MSDKPPRRPEPADDPGFEVIDGLGYEVIEPPAAKPPVARARVVARAVGPKPPSPPTDDRTDDEDDADDRPLERRPARPTGWAGRNRTVLFWGGVAAALGLVVLVAGVVTPVVRAWADKPPPPTPAVRPGALQRPPEKPLPTPPGGWVEFADPPYADCVVWVPGGVAAETVPLKPASNTPASPVPIHTVRWVQSDEMTYMLSVLPAEPAGRAGEQQLTDMLAGFRDSAGLQRFGTNEFMTVGGRRGVENRFLQPDGRLLMVRATIGDGNAYILAASGPAKMDLIWMTVLPFFDGFRLTPGATPPPGAVAPPLMATPPAQTAKSAAGPTRPPQTAPAPARPAEKPADLGPTPAPTPPPDGWAAFPDPQGAFAARMPDGPPPASQPVQAWGATTVMPRGWVWERGGLKYHLIAVEEWPKPRADAPPKPDAEADRANRSHLGWLPSYVAWAGPFRPAGPPRAVWLAGRRAAAETRTAADGSVLHLRGLVADGAGYYLAVVGPAGLADAAPEVASFFDGFQLTPGAAPPAGPRQAGRPKGG